MFPRSKSKQTSSNSNKNILKWRLDLIVFHILIAILRERNKKHLSQLKFRRKQRIFFDRLLLLSATPIWTQEAVWQSQSSLFQTVEKVLNIVFHHVFSGFLQTNFLQHLYSMY
jgi:hypothetical protein